MEQLSKEAILLGHVGIQPDRFPDTLVLEAMEFFADQEVKSNSNGICNIIVGECGMPEWLDQPITVSEIKDVISFHAKNTAIAFARFISNHRLDFQPAKNGNWIGLDMVTYTNEQLYAEFQLYTQSLNK